ncbi:MAG: hypothetical protein WCF84_12540 [Anaerolineae bacterium]
MEKKRELCYQCGWLGLCAIACPLSDPARMIPPDYSTHPGMDADADEAFEIVIRDSDAPESCAADAGDAPPA